MKKTKYLPSFLMLISAVLDIVSAVLSFTDGETLSGISKLCIAVMFAVLAYTFYNNQKIEEK